MLPYEQKLLNQYETDLKQLHEKKKDLISQLKEVVRDITLKRFYCRELRGKEVS